MTSKNPDRLAFVVVDNPVERDQYVSALEHHMFHVIPFHEEKAALAELAHTSPHIAIVHFVENLRRTVELIQQLSHDDPTVSILYPTFYHGGSLHEKAAAAGVYEVLDKPFQLYDGQFRLKLEKAFEESRSRKQAAAAKRQALVVMPFAKSFDQLYTDGIKEPIEALGYRCERIDEMFFTGNIVQKLYEKIEQSQLIIADLSDLNPNVFYETGFADALKKTVILLANEATELPFNIRGRRVIVYNDIPGLKKELEAHVKAIMTVED